MHNISKQGNPNYMLTVGVIIAILTVTILCSFYIVRLCKKYKTVGVEDNSNLSTFTFASIYNLEEGWGKTVHPIHPQCDSDEESQTTTPMHEKYKQLSLPFIV